MLCKIPRDFWLLPLAHCILFLLQALTTLFEPFMSPVKRMRLQALRANLSGIRERQREMERRFKAGDHDGGIEAMNGLMDGLGDPAIRRDWQAHHEQMRDMRQRSDALVRIRNEAGEDLDA